MLSNIDIGYLLWNTNIEEIKARTCLEYQDILPALRKLKVSKYTVSTCNSGKINIAAVKDGTIYSYLEKDDDWRLVYVAETYEIIKGSTMFAKIRGLLSVELSEEETAALAIFCSDMTNRINNERLENRLTYNLDLNTLELSGKEIYKIDIGGLDSSDRVLDISIKLMTMGYTIDMCTLSRILMRIKIQKSSVVTYNDGETELNVTSDRALYMGTNATPVRRICSLDEDLSHTELIERIVDNILDDSKENEINEFFDKVFSYF